MKVLYVREVLGLAKLHYYLRLDNKEKHDQYLTELLNAGYLEDVSEVFTTEEDKNFVRTSHGFLENQEKIYVMPSNWDEIGRRLRTEDIGIAIVEKYNQYLDKPMTIEFKEIEEKDYARMFIAEWDDGSESVLFNE